jgi:hypothetical protein
VAGARERDGHHVHHFALFDAEGRGVFHGHWSDFLGIDHGAFGDRVGAEFAHHVLNFGVAPPDEIVRDSPHVDHGRRDLGPCEDFAARDHNPSCRQRCLDVLRFGDLRINHDADGQRHNKAAADQDVTKSLTLHAVIPLACHMGDVNKSIDHRGARHYREARD